jgi:hypothetical protein
VTGIGIGKPPFNFPKPISALITPLAAHVRVLAAATASYRCQLDRFCRQVKDTVDNTYSEDRRICFSSISVNNN